MLIYGRNSSLEYLNKGKVKKIYLQKGFSDATILQAISQKEETVDKYFLDRMCNHGVHQGIALEVEDFEYSDIYDYLDQASCSFVLLDHLEDPHNLGAIIRTVEAAGLDGVIIPKNRSVEVNATVIKTSVGTTSNVPIFQVTNLVDTISLLKKNGFWIVGTDMGGQDYKTIDYQGKTVLVIGNEGHGMSDLVRKNCDFIASIPMRGEVNSLNASVAAGLMIYEVVRQRF